MICDKCIYKETCQKPEKENGSPDKIFSMCDDFQGVYKNDD